MTKAEGGGWKAEDNAPLASLPPSPFRPPPFLRWCLLCWLAALSLASACPFCTVPKPTLSERRTEADVVVLGEFTGLTADKRSEFLVRQVLQGKDRLAGATTLAVAAAPEMKGGALAILFGVKPDAAADTLDWSVEKVNEASYAYFVKAPSLRTSPAERLAYFARYLENADPLVAEDVYGEFGRAPYDVVVEAAKRLPMESIRRWIVDPNVPQQRKGLYGLVLGLADDETDRRKNLELLKSLVTSEASDFRAGYDGVLGGYLVAGGEPALAEIEERLLANPKAPRGDVLHAITALRFYQEHGQQKIPTPRLARALAHLLDRPEFAAVVIVDLARWQAWDQLPRVTATFTREGFGDAATDRAVVGYLLHCPDRHASEALAKLRAIAPERVAQAEKSSLLPAPGR